VIFFIRLLAYKVDKPIINIPQWIYIIGKSIDFANKSIFYINIKLVTSRSQGSASFFYEGTIIMGVLDHSVGLESSDHKWDSFQKHCIKVETKLAGCCIDENRR
jgi:hypothetical protein